MQELIAKQTTYVYRQSTENNATNNQLLVHKLHIEVVPRKLFVSSCLLLREGT